MALSLSLLVEYASDIAFEKFAVHGLGHVPDERGSLSLTRQRRCPPAYRRPSGYSKSRKVGADTYYLRTGVESGILEASARGRR